ASSSTSESSGQSADLKQRRLVKINRQSFAVSVGDGTLAIGKRRVVDGATSLQLAAFLNRDTGGDAIVDRDLGDVCDGHEQTAVLDELLQVCYAPDLHTASHIVGLVGRESYVRRQVRLPPGNRTSALRHPVHDGLGRATDGREDDHVVFLAQVKGISYLVI